MARIYDLLVCITTVHDRRMMCYYLTLATVTLQDAILGSHFTNRRLAGFLMALFFYTYILS